MSKPFFSVTMLRTDPAGHHQAFSGTDRVSAYDDRFEIGKLKVPYEDVVEIRLYDKVLHIVHITPEGRRMERYFTYESFLPGKDRKALQALVERVSAILKKVKPRSTPPGAASHTGKEAGATTKSQVSRGSANQKAGAAPGQAASSLNRARGAEAMGEVNGRQEVAVFTSLIAFPAICPSCGAPAETVLALTQPAGALSMESTRWMIPVCHKHRKMGGSVVAKPRKSPTDPWVFRCKLPEYALALLNLNDPLFEERDYSQTMQSPLFQKIQNGTRFFSYRFAVGAIIFASLQTSPVFEVKPGKGTVLDSIPYSFLSLLLGWWSIPSGPIFTITALTVNFRGGIDVTDHVKGCLTGH